MPTDVYVATKGEHIAVFSTLEALKEFTKWAPPMGHPIRNVPEQWGAWKAWGPVTINSPGPVYDGGRRRTRRRRTTRKR